MKVFPSYRVILFCILMATVLIGCASKEDRVQADLERLSEELRLYFTEHGTYPKTLSELDISIPNDPFGDGPYRYININNELVRVYSVGRDGNDDSSFQDVFIQMVPGEKDPIFEILQIAGTADDESNGMPFFMRAARLFRERLGAESAVQESPMASMGYVGRKQPPAEGIPVDSDSARESGAYDLFSLSNDAQSVLENGWAPNPNLERCFTEFEDVFALIRQGAAKPRLAPAALPFRLNTPKPSVLNYPILAKLMIAHGKKLAAEGKLDAAQEDYFAVIRFGQSCGYGTIFGKGIDNAIGQMGYEALLRNTGGNFQTAIDRIQNLEKRSPRFSVVLRVEKEIAQKALSVFNEESVGAQLNELYDKIGEYYEVNAKRVDGPFPDFEEYRPSQGEMLPEVYKMLDVLVTGIETPYTRDRIKSSTAYGTTVSLALRLFNETHGEYPEQLDQLVPDILAEQPIDPLSNREYLYKTPVAYSVGPDLQDDGAETIYAPSNGLRSRGDILFNPQ